MWGYSSFAYTQTRDSGRLVSAALSLHFELPELGLTYENCVRYIKELGATHISINVQVSMAHTRDSTLSFTGEELTKMEDVERVLLIAQQHDLNVIFLL